MSSPVFPLSRNRLETTKRATATNTKILQEPDTTLSRILRKITIKFQENCQKDRMSLCQPALQFNYIHSFICSFTICSFIHSFIHSFLFTLIFQGMYSTRPKYIVQSAYCKSPGLIQLLLKGAYNGDKRCVLKCINRKLL